MMQRFAWKAAFGAFTLVVAISWGYDAYRDRQLDLTLAEQRLASTGLLLSQHADRAVEAGETAVLGAAELVGSLAPASLASPEIRSRLHQQLRRLIEGSAQIGSLWVLDAEGFVVAQTSADPPVSEGSFAERDYFQAHLGAAPPGLFVGGRGTGTITGQQRFIMSRAIERQDGSFGGVAVAGVYSDYFSGLYEKADLRDVRVRLETRSGELLSEWAPGDTPAPGETISATSALPSYPIQITLERPTDSVLEGWRRRVFGTAVAALLVIAGFGILTVLGLRITRRERAARQALHEANETLERRIAERIALQAATKRALERAIAGEPLAGLLQGLAEAGREQLGGGTAIFLPEPARDALVLAAAAGLPAGFRRAIATLPTDGRSPSLSAASLGGSRVVTGDLLADPRWSHWRPVLREHGIRASCATPIRSVAGEVLGTYTVYFDRPREPGPGELETVDLLAQTASLLIERQRNVGELADREERLRLIFDSVEDYAIITLDPEGIITSWNSGAQRILGYEEEEVVGRHGRIFFTPEDQAAGEPEHELATALRLGRANDERWQIRKDGSRFWASGLSFPLQGGNHRGFVKIFRDLTDRKESEEHTKLLIDELNHRVKNTLATVQAIATQALRGSGTEAEVKEALESRLVALSRSHDLLTREGWEGAELRDVVAQALQPFAGGRGEAAGRLAVEGPEVTLRPKAALSLGMALHELATNAAKYGALSLPAGTVAVAWRVAGDGAERSLRIRWQERGGPPVGRPGRRGFGSRLVQQGLAHELAAEVEMDFAPEGLVCNILVPYAEATGETGRAG